MLHRCRVLVELRTAEAAGCSAQKPSGGRVLQQHRQHAAHLWIQTGTPPRAPPPPRRRCCRCCGRRCRPWRRRPSRRGAAAAASPARTPHWARGRRRDSSGPAASPPPAAPRAPPPWGPLRAARIALWIRRNLAPRHLGASPMRAGMPRFRTESMLGNAGAPKGTRDVFLEIRTAVTQPWSAKQACTSRLWTTDKASTAKIN